MNLRAIFILTVLLGLHSTVYSKTCETVFNQNQIVETISIEEFISEIADLCDSADSIYSNNGKFKFRHDPYDYHGQAARKRLESYQNFIEKVRDLENINDHFQEQWSIASASTKEIYLQRVADAILAIKLTIFEDLPYITQDIMPYGDREKHQALIDQYDERLINIAEFAMVETGYQLGPGRDYRLRQDFQAFNNPPKVTYPVFKPNKRIDY